MVEKYWREIRPPQKGIHQILNVFCFVFSMPRQTSASENENLKLETC